MKPHYWQGEWIDDRALDKRLDRLAEWSADCAAERLDVGVLLSSADLFARRLKTRKGGWRELVRALRSGGTITASEAAQILDEAAAFLERDCLERKLDRELGSREPFLPRRPDYGDCAFEAWAPLGLLVHVAPSNSPAVAPLSVVEGLLSGNVNFLKTSSTDGDFAALFLKELADCDPTGSLARFIVAARFSSRRADRLGKLFSAADGIAVWGGEEAVAAVKKAAPASARVIAWGHKISFLYLSGPALRDEKALEAAARECCQFEQQACSSPQCLYLDAADWSAVKAFGARFAPILEKISRATPRVAPSPAERAEITLAVELAREEASFGKAEVVEGRGWRLLLDARPALAASPLYRTVWVKPLPRADILKTLRPMRAYLQTAGLACAPADAAVLAERLVAAGAVRVRRVGEMAASYAGEPHDGVYALSRYCRRVSLQVGDPKKAASSFADLRTMPAPVWKKKPRLMTKADFQKSSESLGADAARAQLFFKSGGSSGEPKLSVFTYDDYRAQMRAGAEGLFAAGLDPAKDRCMNLFFSGALYGGFLSIFSVLEDLRAIQFPMAAQLDYPMVADAIVRNKVDVLLGMPSYLVSLFETCADVLGKYRGVKKLFYGGEHFNDAQRRWLAERFGVESIKSVGYGSVDTGPLGYQCVACEGGAHHLHQRLQYLEILDLEKDKPAAPGKIGRLIFTSRLRKGQSLDRYELGDVGQEIPGPCPCGRAAPRFRLLGRSGDVFRIGTEFLNYRKFAAILSEKLNYTGPVQLRLTADGLKEKVVVRLAAGASANGKAREVLLAGYDDLREAVVEEKMLALDVVHSPAADFEKTKGSGKLVRLVDERKR